MARTFFTRNEIRRALRRVRTKLLNGKITRQQFRMDTALTAGPSPKRPMCGTVACIGGHMAIELDPGVLSSGRGMRAVDLMWQARTQIPNLYPLFYYYPDKGITRRAAAAAITRSLDGAPNPWKARR